MRHAVRTKRIYDEPAPTDGVRVLVDRLWPRGVSRQRAALDAWLKEVAPTPELRAWFGHDPARWEEFRARYLDELRNRGPQRAALGELRAFAEQGPVTLLYAARPGAPCHADVLVEELLR